MLQASKRVTYSGACLSAAKAISDAGHGGQVMLGISTFDAMPKEVWEDGGCVLLHYGSHHLKGQQRHVSWQPSVLCDTRTSNVPCVAHA